MERWRPVMLTCLVVSLVLGGCADSGNEDRDQRETDEGRDDRDTNGSDPAQPGLATGLAPLWFPGLYWTYTVSSPQLTSDPTLGLLVHGAEGSAGWRLHTDADATLLAILSQQGFPYLMTVDGGSWAYETHRDEHDLWDFPIEDDETWSVTDHHGRTFDATAVRNTTTTPGGRTVDAYDITFSAGDVTWLQVIYTPAVAGFTHATIDGNLDGHVDVTLDLTDVGSTGQRSAYDPVQVRTVASSSAQGPTTDLASPTSFEVGPGPTTHLGAWTWMQGTGGIHRTSVALGNEDLFVFEWRNTNGTLVHHVETAVAPYATGDGGSLGHVIVGDGATQAEVVTITIGAEAAEAGNDG